MATYQDIRRQVENLTPDEQLRLLEELAAIVRRRMAPKPKRSIMEEALAVQAAATIPQFLLSLKCPFVDSTNYRRRK